MTSGWESVDGMKQRRARAGKTATTGEGGLTLSVLVLGSF